MTENNGSQERISQKLSSPVSKEKGKKGILIVCICGCIVLIAIILILAMPSRKTETRNVVVTPENVDEVTEDLNKQKTQLGQYEVTMNSNWEFEKGDSVSSNAYVENSTSNTNDVYFDIVRTDTGETILKSPTIPVGSHLENITLDKFLDKGTYACMLTYYLLDDSGKTISKLNINLSINVKN